MQPISTNVSSRVRCCVTCITMAMANIVPMASAQEKLTENTLTLGPQGTMPLASLDALSWMAGRWVGKGLGGTIEEIWSPAQANGMVGTFRLIVDNKPSFYEICLISEERGTIVYKVKHFHPDLTGWEAQDAYVSFPLVKIDGDTIYFEGLTIKRDGDKCTQYVVVRRDDGTRQEQVLEFERAECQDTTR